MSIDRELTQERLPTYRRARRLACWTTAYLASVGIVLYLVMGSSRAMRAAYLETVFSLLTPILFLAGGWMARRPPSRRYPYGLHRWVSLAFLGAAAALFALGLYLSYDAVTGLWFGSEASIGTASVFGYEVWLGWPMFAALAWAAIPAWFIGRAQRPHAKVLHDKVLDTDAKMRQADWLTSVAAAIGVVGIGSGVWWLDPLAEGIIAGSVLWNGFQELRHACSDLADSAPTTIDGAPDPVTRRVRDCLLAQGWIAQARVRLREEGRLIFGEAEVVPRSAEGLVENIAEASRAVSLLDWRIRSFTIMPVAALPPEPTMPPGPFQTSSRRELEGERPGQR